MDPFRTDGELLAILADWSSGPGPLNRKLARAIRRAVDDGSLVPGEHLPSERHLAGLLAISRTTVVAAYDSLRVQDVLDSRRGSGTRVSARVPRRRSDGRVPGGHGTTVFHRLIRGPGEVISLACAAQGGEEEVAEAVREVVDEELPALLADPGYRPRGLLAFREAVADHLTDAGLPTAPDQVLATNGSQQALALTADLYLRRGATVVVEDPGWPTSLDVFRDSGARLTGVPLDDEGVQLGPLARALAGDPPALLYTMPAYHNPTGVLMSPARRRAVAELAARHDVPVVEDHAYNAPAGAGGMPVPLAACAPPGTEIITLGSLGKVIWGGLRAGWARGPSAIIERLTRRKALADLGGPVLDQAIAARLLRRYPDLAARRSKVLRERLALLEDLLTTHLPDWRWRRPDGGACLWVRLPRPDATVYAQVALRHGVEIVPGLAMDPDGRHDDHLRIPFTFDPPVLRELVHRLTRAWSELQRHGPADSRPGMPVI